MYNACFAVEYHIQHYDLEQGALEIQYIEEFFGEFPRKKTAAEIVRRLHARAHQILLATTALPDDPGTIVPVSDAAFRDHNTAPSLPSSAFKIPVAPNVYTWPLWRVGVARGPAPAFDSQNRAASRCAHTGLPVVAL